MQRELLDGQRLYVLPNFLTPDECTRLIAQGNELGFEPATIGGEVFENYRNNARVVHDDVELAAWLWSRAEAVVTHPFEDERAVGFNPRLRFYRYQSKEAFAPHYDGSVRLDDGSMSRMTFMLYLNDVASGGETRFYDQECQLRHEVRPRQGMALVFDHLMLHEGVVVHEGCKYVLRTDMMFAPVTP